MMAVEPGSAVVAALLSEPSRAAMLDALMDGRWLTATELANRARITPQTASSHLKKLVQGNLLTMKRHGRFRYYRIKDQDVARVLESLSLIAPSPRVQSLRESTESKRIKQARTCYDHLAGRLGVDVTSRLVEKGWLQEGENRYEVTAVGERELTRWGVDLTECRRTRRKLAYPCLDWSERRYHLGGALGAAIVSRLFADGWIRRIPDSRAVALTKSGKEGLYHKLGVES
jgi:DNA-binding transcriptional ArsR family regulator